MDKITTYNNRIMMYPKTLLVFHELIIIGWFRMNKIQKYEKNILN